MSRILVWMLGGGTVAVGAAVAGWLVLDQQRGTPPGDAPQAAAPLSADGAPQGEAATETVQAPQPTPTGTPVETPRADAAPESAPDIATDPEPSIAAQPAENAAETPLGPVFDVVRVARDGAALVAGAATPGAAVTLRVDGVVVAQTAADPGGQFVAMFDLGTSDAAQIMTLEMAGADGVAVLSDDTVVLTPRPAEPVAVAEAANPEAPVAATAQSVEMAQVDPASPEAGRAESMAAEAMTGTAPRGDALAEPPAQPQIATAAGGDAPAEPMIATADAEVAPAHDGAEAAPEAAPEALPDLVARAPADAATSAPNALVQPEEAAGAAPLAETPLAETADPGGLADAATPRTAMAEETGDDARDAGAAPAGQAAPPPETQLAQAPEMPTAFVVSGSGAVRVLDPAPQVMDNVVIDSISYSAEGDVQIAGRAARAEPGGSLRIYLDNRPIALARADRGGWASDLPHVDPGVYTLRVDQLDDAGGVVSRFETPFQREDPAVVARAQAAQARVAASAPGDAPPAQGEGAEPGASASDAVAPADGAGPTPQDAATIAAQQPADTQPDTLEPGSAQPADGQPLAAAAPGPSAPATPVAEGQAGAGVAPQYPAAPGTATLASPRSVTSPSSPVSLVTVQPGHTLWAISRDRYGAGELYVVIYRANQAQIRNPNLIYPGQIFELPEQ